MNLLFMTLLYHPKHVREVARASKSGIQNQINSYEWAFIEGLRDNQQADEQLHIINALPVGIFPIQYSKLFLPTWEEADFQELGCINVPWFKQWIRKHKAIKELKKWVREGENNRHILVYSLYMPFMQAVAWVKRKYPEVQASIIITDLPNELGISSGRQGMMKRIEYAMGKKRMDLCADFDRFVLLTEHMSEVLPIDGKPQMVIEGLILSEPLQNDADSSKNEMLANDRSQSMVTQSSSGLEAFSNSPFPQTHPMLPVVLYTGTLNRELGIGELLEAFQLFPDCELWLCGKGDMEAEIKDAIPKSPNIHYLGFVSQAEALRLQQFADILINPRSPKGAFTRYSFPSKTLEYMRAGKPVLCYPLEGIPHDYDPFLVYIKQEGAAGIRQAVQELLALPREKRDEIGMRAKEYVLANKNPQVQCKKLMAFLREDCTE